MRLFGHSVGGFLKNHRGFFMFLLLLGVFRGAIADWSPVPTGSMNPTIVEGDLIWVNKVAYDLHLPFTSVQLARLSEPARGDIVVFNSEKADKRLVKRIMGLPGDTVAMENNQLIVNGQYAHYEVTGHSVVGDDLTESYQQFTHAMRLSAISGRLDSFRPIQIPDKHYLMLGDNRDNSADSRVYGLVPRHEIVGRASHVLMSLNPERLFLPRIDRFIKPLI